MKFVIVLACLFAVAYANEDANVIKNEIEVLPDSSHQHLQLDNKIEIDQDGKLKDKETWEFVGGYSYVSKEGKLHKVTYVADEHGYQPKIETI